MNISEVSFRSLFKISIRNIFFTTLGRSFGFLIPFLIAYKFGVNQETDVFFLIFGIVMFVDRIFSGSFEQIIIPFISEKRINQKKTEAFSSSIFTSSLILSILIFILYNILSIFFLRFFHRFDYDSLIKVNFIFSFIILLSTNSSLVSGMLKAFKRFDFTALMPLYRSIPVILAIIFLSKKQGIIVVILGYVVGEIIKFLAAFCRVRTIINLKILFEKMLKNLSFFRVAGIQSAAIVLWSINPVVDNIMASFLEVGSISKIEYIHRLILIPITLISIAVITVFYSYYSDAFHEKGFMFLKEKGIKFLKFASVSLTILLILLYLSAPIIIKLFLGYNKHLISSYDELLNIFYFYVPAILPWIIGLFFVRMQMILKSTGIILKASLLSFILNIILNVLFIKIFGIKGIALSTTIVLLIQTCFITIRFFKGEKNEKKIA